MVMRMKKVVFACVGNSFRSQIAAALFNAAAPEGWLAESAGVNPASEVMPETVQLLKEVGIDISSARPRQLTRAMMEQAELVVTMGCGPDACPAGFEDKIVAWNVPSPPGKAISELRSIMVLLENLVEKLIEDIDKDLAARSEIRL